MAALSSCGHDPAVVQSDVVASPAQAPHVAIVVPADAGTDAALSNASYEPTGREGLSWGDAAAAEASADASVDSGTFDASRSDPADAAVPVPTAETGGAEDASTPATADARTLPVQPAAPGPAPTSPAADASISAPDVSVQDASAAPACAPGHYAGSFQGQVPLNASLTLSLDGSVSFDLVANAQGTLLTLENGSIMAQDPAGQPVRASIEGQIDCNSKQLEMGALEGSYGQADAGVSASVTGTVTGSYAGSPASVSGNWTASTQPNNLTASGTFSAVLAN